MSSNSSNESSAQYPSGARDFDFLIGSWQVRNRRLHERLVGCDTWIQFPATLEVRPALGGLGNVDKFVADFQGQRVEALTLRIFNPETRKWSLYWVDNRTAVLQPPVVGSFASGRGEFFADDSHQGTPVIARFLWSDITDDSAHWEQAFSVDDGQSWETNWTMDFDRVSR
jgi:hypothetical protein